MFAYVRPRHAKATDEVSDFQFELRNTSYCGIFLSIICLLVTTTAPDRHSSIQQIGDSPKMKMCKNGWMAISPRNRELPTMRAIRGKEAF